MLTWCSRAVNFNFPSCFAASRTRSSPLVPLPRLGVRRGLDSGVFSLVNGLPSTTSAGDGSLLFGCFAGTTPLYDSPLPCARDLSLIAFSLRPATFRPRAATGSPGSRAWNFSACMGSSTPRDCGALALSHAALLPSDQPDTVGFPHRKISELYTQPTDTPVQRFKCGLTAALAWLGARVVRYAFPVRLFHPLVGSRIGAVPVGCADLLLPVSSWECPNNATVGPAPIPASSNPACGFPALGFPVCFLPRLCG